MNRPARDKILSLHAEYLKLKSAVKLAARLGTTYQTLLKWFREEKLRVRKRGGYFSHPHPRAIDEAKIRRAHARYLKIGNLNEAGREFGVIGQTLTNWFRRLGLKCRPRGGANFKGSVPNPGPCPRCQSKRTGAGYYHGKLSGGHDRSPECRCLKCGYKWRVIDGKVIAIKKRK